MAETPKAECAYLKLVITKDVYAKIKAMKDNLPGQYVNEVLIRVQVSDTEAHDAVLSMSDFLDAVGLADADEIIKPCDTCEGSGEVTTMEPVYQGEPHMAPTGTAKCPDCSVHEPSED